MASHRSCLSARFTMKTFTFSILASSIVILFGSGCVSGRRYPTGTLRFEKVNIGIMQLARDEEGCRYSYFHNSIYQLGARPQGTQYVSMLEGLILSVNIPGGSWILYPFQYNDLHDGKKLFGVGSGYSDLRFSILWGFLSIGRNWNFLWLRGFWFGRHDPVYEGWEEKGTVDS